MNKNMMRFNQSFKLKVFALLGGLNLALFVVYFLILLLASYVVEDSIINRLLSAEANYLRSSYENSSDIEARLDYMRVYSSVETMPKVFVDQINRAHADKEIFTESGEHFHYRPITMANGDQVYLVAEVGRLLVVTNMSRDILVLTLTVLFAALGLSLMLTYKITQFTVGPVLALAESVRNAEFKDKAISLPHTESKNEVGYLANSLQSALNALNDARKREADFTRDASHELRTPITAIRNCLRLAGSRPLNKQEQSMLSAQVDNMASTIDVLLALARDESIDATSFLLRRALEESVLKLYARLEAQGFIVTLDVPEDIEIVANEQLFQLLVVNLIDNAMRYASSPELFIHAKDNLLFFENQITSAVDNALIGRGAKSPDSLGVGQGLYLVSRIIDSLAWKFSINSDENTFVLKVES